MGFESFELERELGRRQMRVVVPDDAAAPRGGEVRDQHGPPVGGEHGNPRTLSRGRRSFEHPRERARAVAKLGVGHRRLVAQVANRSRNRNGNRD